MISRPGNLLCGHVKCPSLPRHEVSVLIVFTVSIIGEDKVATRKFWTQTVNFFMDVTLKTGWWTS